MGELEPADRFGDPGGLAGIERTRKPGLDIAESAGAGANVTQDHESRMLFLPAFANIGTARFLADGDETMHLDELSRRPLRRAWRLDPDPIWLARHRLIRPVRFFRVPEPPRREVLVTRRINTQSHAALLQPVTRPSVQRS